MLVVIDNTWLFGEAMDARQADMMRMGAQATARGLAVETVADTPELRATLKPWAERPEGVGAPRPTPESIQRKLALAGPRVARPPTVAARPIKTFPTAPPASGIHPVRHARGWMAEVDGRQFFGGTKAEVRLKAEAWVSLPADAASAAPPEPVVNAPAASSATAPAATGGASPAAAPSSIELMLMEFEARVTALETARLAQQKQLDDLVSTLAEAKKPTATKRVRRPQEPKDPTVKADRLG